MSDTDLSAIAESNTQIKERKFQFKRTKEEKLAGVPVTPALKLDIPVPTWTGIAHAATQDEKFRKFITSLIEDAVFQAARMQVDDDENPVKDQKSLDLSKLDILYIANLPPAQRQSIGKEVWDDWVSDYIDVTVATTGRPKAQVEKAAAILLKKFNPIRGDSHLINIVWGTVEHWMVHTERAEEFENIIQNLLDRKNTLTEPQALLTQESLGLTDMPQAAD